MNHGNVAALFAGQGVFQDLPLTPGPLRDHIRETFAEIDRVAADRLGITLSGNVLEGACYRHVRGAAPEFTQLAVLGLSVAAYRHRENGGWRPAALVGHGLGEIVALVAGGALSVSEGAEIVCERAAVLEKYAKGIGSMVRVGAGAAAAEDLVRAAGQNQASVAAENSPTDTVIAGSYSALDTVVRRAIRRDIPVKRLAACYPLHCEPLMRAAAAAFSKRLNGAMGNAPRVPVFSPILGQYYPATGSLAESVAGHLVRPVRFWSAVRELSARGIDRFEDCGVLRSVSAPMSVGAGVTARGLAA